MSEHYEKSMSELVFELCLKEIDVNQQERETLQMSQDKRRLSSTRTTTEVWYGQ